jgi:pseudouridine synthase
MPEERLQKILARAGIASRRKAEELMLAGRVTVNGAAVMEMGAKADAARDHIKVDGKLIRFPKQTVVIALNKPREVVTTVSDPEGRRTVMHVLGRAVKERVFPIGRLDYHSEGLLLLTNDGDLALRVMSPATHLEKTYVVKANGSLTEEQMEHFRNGVALYGKRTASAQIRPIRGGANPWYEVVITEGRQNQVRLMFRHLGRLVEKLRRVRIGPLTLGDLAPGEFRYLDEREAARLRRAVGLEAPRGRPHR